MMRTPAPIADSSKEALDALWLGAYNRQRQCRLRIERKRNTGARFERRLHANDIVAVGWNLYRDHRCALRGACQRAQLIVEFMEDVDEHFVRTLGRSLHDVSLPAS
jgi:hypothetical protein